ncbi:MAG TPA: glycosyltransferase family 39 protein [Actinomycetota bacterium]|nr:glycosyltransferase family 39 protein [Actinomycetota bacterium]
MKARMGERKRSDLVSLLQREGHLYEFLIGCGIIILWIRPLRSSFWLDELGTYWVVRAGLADAIDLALKYQGQSPAYYLIAWLARNVGRGSEAVLRSPSLLAGLFAAILVGRLGRRLFGPNAGWASALVFAATPIVTFSAVNARPYAFAYLALAAATVSLINLLEDRGARWGPAYGAAVAATIHFHYLFGFALLGHVPFLLSRWPGRERPARRGLWTALAILAILLFPLIFQIPYLLAHARIPDLPLGRPSMEALLISLVPLPILAGLVLGLLIARSIGPIELQGRGEQGALTLVAGLWLAGPSGLLLSSVASDINLMWPTYARSSALGAALLVGAGVATIRSPTARRIVLLLVAICGQVAANGRWYADQDWRGAVAEVNALIDDPGTPVLMHAAFVEGTHVALLRDPGYRSLLLAPLSRYPVQGKIVPIPFDLTDASESYLERRVVPSVEGSHRLVLVTLENGSGLTAWFQGRLQPLGFESRRVGDHGAVQVTLFERGRPHGARGSSAGMSP